MFIVKAEGCIKGYFVGVCPKYGPIIIDDLEDPRENKLIKSENTKPRMIVGILKDRLRMQIHGEELVRPQLKDCCESQAERS